jgi:hypothetical protein
MCIIFHVNTYKTFFFLVFSILDERFLFLPAASAAAATGMYSMDYG